MPQILANKIAIITGASRGIGAAIAKRFAAEGARVVITARTGEPGGRLPGSLQETADYICSRGGKCLSITGDLSKEEDRERIMAQTLEHWGGVDILVNNAAFARFAPTQEQRARHVQLSLGINFIAPLHLSQLAVPVMVERGGGWILNLSSATSQRPGCGPYYSDDRAYRFHNTASPSLYGATKAALERLTAGWAMELASQSIAINSLAPVEAVASEGALDTGSIDDQAIFEPIEAMAEAALALCSGPRQSLTGRNACSLPLLEELGLSVRALDGRSELAPQANQ
ncbi:MULTISPECIES: SDR family NAD(P)-dependent oxidoreductase [Pseudomonas]|uniref:SDR family oxidoreductase n=1 Tax=Pseudomonas auratipiscis TaxID=3115853 RepID=A0AB35WL16_9PSED|nr:MULTISPECIES: SDR family oxidoreductase [unclassified Pseudomonas]MEE1864877.1 SDR family oxidoreductase [Pseudomonas sp. 120P]MEE1956182.1 SDR family oxidoreductase [Pseudomonas sp. 119P]